jgi:hypothetical protein
MKLRFRPKTFRTNFCAWISEQFSSQNSRKKCVFDNLEHTLRVTYICT